MSVSVSDAVSHLDVRDAGAELSYNADALMADDGAAGEVVEVGAAEAGVGCLDVDFAVAEGVG